VDRLVGESVKAEARQEKLVAMLRDRQWVGYWWKHGSFDQLSGYMSKGSCIECRSFDEHAPDCALAALLEEVGDES
jgi:hypothetical protein